MCGRGRGDLSGLWSISTVFLSNFPVHGVRVRVRVRVRDRVRDRDRDTDRDRDRDRDTDRDRDGANEQSGLPLLSSPSFIALPRAWRRRVFTAFS